MKFEAGVIGLGIMGSALAGNLLSAGKPVIGFDVDAAARKKFGDAGGDVTSSAGEVAAGAPIVLVSLPSSSALRDVTEDVCRNGAPGCILVECSTLPIDEKQASLKRLAERDIVLLDCPVSGTGAQAAAGDLVMLASGDPTAVQQCQPVFDAISRTTHYLGRFGNGMKMKFIANLLVAIHNASTAEALVLAQQAGLDPQQTYDVIRDGAGSSRMFEVRGPMMVEGKYDPATMKIDVWRKDLDLIAGFAAELDCPVPLFSQTESLYAEAEALGMDKQDTAAIKRIFEMMAAARKDNNAG
jgi:3-hydroxyisobutyrate dehydrogenase-like beta-hydroxyacid dehydrogenase